MSVFSTKLIYKLISYKLCGLYSVLSYNLIDDFEEKRKRFRETEWNALFTESFQLCVHRQHEIHFEQHITERTDFVVRLMVCTQRWIRNACKLNFIMKWSFITHYVEINNVVAIYQKFLGRLDGIQRK